MEEGFFRENWAALQEAKNNWDADGLFWAPKSVRSDRWVLDSEGKLCMEPGGVRFTRYYLPTWVGI